MIILFVAINVAKSGTYRLLCRIGAIGPTGRGNANKLHDLVGP